MSISRRVFVKSGGLALFSVGLDPLFLARAALASSRPLPSLTASARPVLVCLFQRGAVDGLNMIVPHGDPSYYRERPRIAVPRADVLDLDGYFGLQLAFADVTGWDTHVNQGASEGQLAGRLADFGQALAAFAQDVGERMRDVVVLTMSEFGRTVRENGHSGTDHGHATAMLVLGRPV